MGTSANTSDLIVDCPGSRWEFSSYSKVVACGEYFVVETHGDVDLPILVAIHVSFLELIHNHFVDLFERICMREVTIVDTLNFSVYYGVPNEYIGQVESPEPTDIPDLSEYQDVAFFTSMPEFTDAHMWVESPDIHVSYYNADKSLNYSLQWESTCDHYTMKLNWYMKDITIDENT